MALTIINEEIQQDTGTSAVAWRVKGPTSYDPRYADIAHGALLFGATWPQLALTLNVSQQTLAEWRDRHPEFAAVLRESAEQADLLVFRSFYRRALGYTVITKRKKITQTTRRETQKRRGRPVEAPVTTTIQEATEDEVHIPADIAAAKMWLRLRRSWGDGAVNLDDLLRFAEVARQEAARRGLDIDAAEPSAAEAGASGQGADESSGADPDDGETGPSQLPAKAG